MARKLVGIENDGIKAKVIYNVDGKYKAEDLKVGITTIDELVKEIVSS
tara:strand:+ start:6117 stop:6260 length:144 start_codon:yes stop_codon:yes gene_type:complete